MKLTRGLRMFFGSKIEVKIPTIEGHLLNQALPTVTTTTPEELINYHREMLKMRRMEIACDMLYKNKEIFGFCHLYDGQEAIALGIKEAVTYEDPLITAYRTHCQALTRGIPMWKIFAEMIGTEGAATMGKGGSMHFYSKKANFYGGSGIIGDQISVGTGLAYALKYKKKPNCSIVMYGDGAANQGQLYESANMASIWKIPVIYICENNHYAMGTPTERGTAGTDDFHKKMYNVPGLSTSGQHIFGVRETIKFAKEFAVENGPIAINLKTYRFHGHSMSDPGITYRTREEVQQKRKTEDPLLFTKQLILDNSVLSEKELKDLDHEVKDFVNAELAKAKSGKEIDETHLLDDVYDKDTKVFIRAPNYEDSVFVQEKLVN